MCSTFLPLTLKTLCKTRQFECFLELLASVQDTQKEYIRSDLVSCQRFPNAATPPYWMTYLCQGPQHRTLVQFHPSLYSACELLDSGGNGKVFDSLPKFRCEMRALRLRSLICGVHWTRLCRLRDFPLRFMLFCFEHYHFQCLCSRFTVYYRSIAYLFIKISSASSAMSP